MRFTKRFYTTLSLLVFLAACTRENSSNQDSTDVQVEDLKVGGSMGAPPEAAMAEAPQAARMAKAEFRQAEPAAEPTDAKLIKMATLRLRVDDVDAFNARAATLVKEAKGYIANQTIRNAGNRVSADLVIRVPASALDRFMDDLSAGAALVVEKNVNVQDVTENFVDTTARLKAKREVEAQYLLLLKRATSVKDMVEIQQQLGPIREEIESTEATLRYLSNRIDFATVSITAYKELESSYVFKGSFLTAIARSFREGVSTLINAFISLVRNWPFVLAALIAYLLFIRRRRRS